MEKQLQVADSFKLEFPSYPSNELNEMSTEETSGDEMELSEMPRGKKWGNSNNNNNHKCILVLATTTATTTNTNRTDLKTTDKASSGHKGPKDSKITLTQESDHYVPTELSSNFFKQFDLAMKLKREELKKQGRSSNQVNELTEGNLIQAFSVTEDQMEKAASILSRNKGTEKSGNSSA